MFAFYEVLAVFLMVQTCLSHPTVYRYNEQNNLEAALVPVSSTVIPMALYESNHHGKQGNIEEDEFPLENLITAKVKEKGFE